jgi:hypothetical protein
MQPSHTWQNGSYRLIVQGELSDTLEPAFPGMTLTRPAGNTAPTGEMLHF